MIREIANVQMIKLGFEKERLENRRVGIPFYDLQKLLKKAQDDETMHNKIITWIRSEFNTVKDYKKHLS